MTGLYAFHPQIISPLLEVHVRHSRQGLLAYRRLSQQLCCRQNRPTSTCAILKCVVGGSNATSVLAEKKPVLQKRTSGETTVNHGKKFHLYILNDECTYNVAPYMPWGGVLPTTRWLWDFSPVLLHSVDSCLPFGVLFPRPSVAFQARQQERACVRFASTCHSVDAVPGLVIGRFGIDNAPLAC